MGVAMPLRAQGPSLRSTQGQDSVPQRQYRYGRSAVPPRDSQLHGMGPKDGRHGSY